MTPTGLCISVSVGGVDCWIQERGQGTDRWAESLSSFLGTHRPVSTQVSWMFNYSLMEFQRPSWAHGKMQNQATGEQDYSYFSEEQFQSPGCLQPLSWVGQTQASSLHSSKTKWGLSREGRPRSVQGERKQKGHSWSAAKGALILPIIITLTHIHIYFHL